MDDCGRTRRRLAVNPSARVSASRAGGAMLSPKMTRPTPLGWARISDTVVSVFPYAGTIWSGHEAVVCLVELDPQPLSARRGAASASARAGARGVSVVL